MDAEDGRGDGEKSRNEKEQPGSTTTHHGNEVEDQVSGRHSGVILALSRSISETKEEVSQRKHFRNTFWHFHPAFSPKRWSKRKNDYFTCLYQVHQI